MPIKWLDTVNIKAQICDEIKEHITPQLNRIEGTLRNLMSQVDDGIAAVQAAVNKLGTDLQAEVAGLQAEIAAGGDTTARVTALSNLATQLQALDATAIAGTPVSAPPSVAAASTASEPAATTEAAPAA